MVPLLIAHMPHLSSAAWGLVGVVVGSVLSTANDVLVERARARRDRLAEVRQENGEARVACRMIGDELDTIAGNLRLLHELGRTLERPVDESGPFLASVEWQEHKATLARILDNPQTWDALTSVYHNVRSLRRRVIVDGPNTPLPPHRMQILLNDAKTAEDLSKALRDAASGAQTATGSVARARR